jgi:para-aminobenzoate synthetase component 1
VRRTFLSRPVTDFTLTKLQLLNWARRFSIFCFLDNHQYPSPLHAHECLLAVGAHDSLEAFAGNAFSKLRDFSNKHQDWLFGHFGYDLKIETEGVGSRLPDGLGFPDLYFFVPEILVELGEDRIRIGSLSQDPAQICDEILSSEGSGRGGASSPVQVRARFSREEYLTAVESLQKHILRGDCYEVNFCQEFYAEQASVEPASLYLRLSEASPTPFGAFYRHDDQWLLCASPERYLKRAGSRLIAQPVKGTRKRDLSDSLLDNASRQDLLASPKERSENVMVVDLVRNDLSKVCRPGSVAVDELYGVYSFPQVHQMISSVSGQWNGEESWTDIIRATFPMGSMTGAPKKRVLELIEQYEKTRRGVFSGALGYLSPEGDFDFNVVIRSILYNETRQYLSFQAGSAITFYSDPAAEYEECLLKAEAIKKVLAG